MVKDIFVIGVWCWNHLFTTIPNTVLFQMESVVIDAIEEDAIIWDEKSSGEYTTKSAYKCLIGEPATQLPCNRIWPCFWQSHILENIKHFFGSWVIGASYH